MSIKEKLNESLDMIDSTNYVHFATKTESSNFEEIKTRITDKMIRLLHAGIGLCTESGEFIDMIKKHVFYGKPLDEVNLKEEIGDFLWYAAIACDTLGIELNDIMRTNIKKLAARYPNKFTQEDAVNRDLEKERKILENK